jgi:DNA-binding beta-propeller fold protein YncE
MKRGWMIGVILLGVAGWMSACESMKPGECKRDNDCEGQVKGSMGVCYKEPPDAGIGKCMSVKEAKESLERYQRKLTGTCDDKDKDGFKSGSACDPPIDCDDSDPAVNPGAAELCDSKDNNCDGRINEGQAHCVGTVLGGKHDPVVKFMTTMTAGVRAAQNGDVWVSDQHQIYRIDGKGNVQRVAGSEQPGNDDKKGKLARFDEPRGMAVGSDGSVYISECRNNCIRKLDADGQVSVYAGKCSSEADDTGKDEIGKAEDARFWCPIDVSFDLDGSLLVADMYNAKIKRVAKDRTVSVVAGKGGHNTSEGVEFGMTNGPALKAEFNMPAGIAVAKDGSIFIADMKNNCVRLLKGGNVTAFAGICVSGTDKGGYRDGPAGAAQFKIPNAVDLLPDGTLLVVDTGNHCIRAVKDGKVTTVTGRAGQQGYNDGALGDALFNAPQSVSVAPDGSFYIVDTGNYRVRRAVP